MKRHPSHDYSSPGGYFVTFSTHGRKKMLGRIDRTTVLLSESGKIVAEVWNALPEYYPNVTLDAFQVMPDHVHCILILQDPKLVGLDSTNCASVPRIIKRFKGASARMINKNQNQSGNHVWQKGFHERVIRSEEELEKHRYYVETNPLRVSLEIRE